MKMKNNVEKDVNKSIDRLSISTSSSSSHTFDLVDKSARKLSDIKEDYDLKKQLDIEKNNLDSNLKTAEETINYESQDTYSKENQTSRLKTSVNDEYENFNRSNNYASKIKTNVNNEEYINENTVEQNSDNSNNNKLKTGVSKAVNKVFKFNKNQGNISKTFTVIGKTGKGVSKIGGKITRTSRELDKAMSMDGSGTEYINSKIGRKVKTKSGKLAKKITSKATKPIKNKLKQTIGKKLLDVVKTLVIKILKLLISICAALGEFIIPLALVILIIIAIGSIFGSSSSSESLNNYSAYMESIQKEYNRQVDNWKLENPEGIVVGVKGDYGQIDWRIPLAIMQSTGAELTFDQNEKNLLEEFKKANLFEKHEVVYQTVEVEDYRQTIEKEIPVLVITNAVYEDYIDWCKNNYNQIALFNKNKKVTNGLDTWFSKDQLDLLEMLYQSNDYAELLGNDFKTRTPSYGFNKTSANLKSEYYNSKNTLATAGFKGQCTWYSFGRVLELFNKKMPTGDAQTWLSSAIAMGYETGTQPSYNSVVVLMGRKFGHVAYVEAYDGKTITISEGNVGNPCSNDDSCSQVEYANEHAEEMVRTKTYNSFDEYRKASKNSGLTIVGFIYLD